MKYTLLIAASALAATPALAQIAAEPIGVAQAVAVAEKATGAQAMEADLDDRGGSLFYEVVLAEGSTLHEVAIDARTGEIVSQRTPRLENLWGGGVEKDEAQSLAGARPLSQLLAALETETGGRVIEVGFDVEAGQARYEVELSTKAGVTDVYFDPATGERIVMVYDD